MSLRTLALAAAAALGLATSASGELSGRVFVDADGNGARDADEPVRAGVAVSNGREVTRTDADGRYRLPDREGFVAVTRPDGFDADPWHRRGGGDFALRPREAPADFTFVHVTDIHAYTDPKDLALYSFPHLPGWLPDWVGPQLMLLGMARFYPDHSRGEVIDAFRRALAPYRDVDGLWSSALMGAWMQEFERPGSEIGRVADAVREALAEIASLRPLFVVNTGDLVVEGNFAPTETTQGWFAFFDAAVRATGLEFHHTIGNNEIAGINLEEIPEDDPLYGRGAYEHWYGPAHYGFDRGPFHFAAVDTHSFERNDEGRPQWSFDRMPPDVRTWLDADLAAHAGRVLVVLNHEPFVTEWPMYDPADDEGLLAAHGVAWSLAGHIHKNGLDEVGATTHVTTGALSGMRWAVPVDLHPRGYRLVRAQDGRLYSAWKQLGEPVLGFVDPPGDAALHPASKAPGDAARFVAPGTVVVVAADRAGPFAAVELSVDGRPAPLERWGAYFARARVEPAALADGTAELRLRARSADGAEREARLQLRAPGAPRD